MNVDKDITFATEMSILRDPNVFIAAMGAMSNTPSYLNSLQNVEDLGKDNTIIDVSGMKISASKCGKLKSNYLWQ